VTICARPSADFPVPSGEASPEASEDGHRVEARHRQPGKSALEGGGQDRPRSDDFTQQFHGKMCVVGLQRGLTRRRLDPWRTQHSCHRPPNRGVLLVTRMPVIESRATVTQRRRWRDARADRRAMVVTKGQELDRRLKHFARSGRKQIHLVSETGLVSQNWCGSPMWATSHMYDGVRHGWFGN
jgi:hypothetical protein